MANLHRGEVSAELDGKTYNLCLTLGALAELEAAFGDEDMLSLINRFEAGRLSARDVQRIIGAGLRGGGSDIDDSQVSSMQTPGGAAGFVDIVARLLRATFSLGHETEDDDAGDVRSASEKPAEVETSAVPFPGKP